MLNRGLKSSRPENDRLFNQPGSTNVSAVRFGVHTVAERVVRWTFVGSHHDSEAASAGECSSVAIGRCPQRDSGERVGKCHHRGRIRLLSWRSRTQRFGKLPKKTTKQT